jgi:hypothetical protein
VIALESSSKIKWIIGVPILFLALAFFVRQHTWSSLVDFEFIGRAGEVVVYLPANTEPENKVALRTIDGWVYAKPNVDGSASFHSVGPEVLEITVGTRVVYKRNIEQLSTPLDVTLLTAQGLQVKIHRLDQK